MSEQLTPEQVQAILSTAGGSRPPAFGQFGATVALLALLALFAWPLGLACHGIWWLFLNGWNVIA